VKRAFQAKRINKDNATAINKRFSIVYFKGSIPALPE
jgi:hypothetical protein